MARRRNKISFPRVNGKTVIFTGGLNEGITSLELRPGDLFRCYNYEEIDGAFHGYSSVNGYERRDGRTSPSDVPIELLPDTGNDKDVVILLESEDSSDSEDKSVFPFTVTQNNITFVDTRFKFGEGSWFFDEDVASQILVDQTGNPIDYSADSFTLDFWVQIDDNVGTSVVVAEKAGVWKLTIEAGKPTFTWDISGGGGYGPSLVTTTTMIQNRWYHISISVKTDSIGSTALTMMGLAGTDVVTTSTGVYNTNANDVTIGDGTASDAGMYLDSFRLSSIARWASASTYAYNNTYPYSDGRFYAFNADDLDREAQRALIGQVPGEGPVRDVHIMQGDGYAIRDKVGGATGGIYKETTSGFAELTNTAFNCLYNTGSIQDGTVANRVTEPFTAAPSGAAGTIFFNTLSTGDPGSNTGEGELIVYVTSGALASGDVITLTNYVTEQVTLTAAPSVTPIGPGDNVDMVTGRFAYYPPDSPNSELLYFVSGDGGFYDTDGTDVRYHSGPSDSLEATHVFIFNNRLWLAYQDGHLWYSAPGDPTQFSTELGAGEIFLGDEISDLVTAPGATMLVIMDESIKFIKAQEPNAATVDYPYRAEDFALKSGGYRHSASSLLGDVFFADDRGPTSMKAFDAAGDFEMGDLKKKTHITYQQVKQGFVGALVHRTKSQYRMMFDNTDNGSTVGISITFSDKKVKGSTIFEYTDRMYCFHEGEDADGTVKMLAGGTESGYMYELDRGTSFDGELIETQMQTAYYHYATPRLWKRFHRVLFEISAPNRMQFFVRPDFNYSTNALMSAREQSLITTGEGGVWGYDQWGSFVWGGSVVSNPMLYFPGYGYNMSVAVATSSKHHEPHVLHNMIVDYSNGSRYM